MKPSPRLINFSLGWLASSFIPVLFPATSTFWWAASFAGLCIILLDAMAVSTRQPLMVERNVSAALPVGTWNTIHLKIHNQGKLLLKLTVFDHFPGHIAAEGLPQRVNIGASGWADINYQLRPTERGDLIFPYTQILICSPAGLWHKSQAVGEPQTCRVYPNFAKVSQYALLATHNHVSQMGIKKQRKRGQGQEFHQLREYRDGDSLRQVDWKATSRQHRLISREYQDERDQQITFLLDCSRHMRAKDDELAHFDHALNALLLLGYVASRQGDTISLQCFGGHSRWLAPRKGGTVVKELMNTLYDVQPTTAAADFEQATEQLLIRQRKRSLVIILTNLRDEDSSGLINSLRLLNRHHLVLVANLREQAIDQSLKQPITDFEQALTYSATTHYLQECRQLERKLRQAKAQVISTTPAGLPPAIVNRYLDIKASGQL